MVSRRQKVKELSSERAAKLQASLAWQQFNRDADEVSQDLCACSLHGMTWHVAVKSTRRATVGDH